MPFCKFASLLMKKYINYIKRQGPLLGKDKDIAALRRDRLTYLDYDAMADIRDAVKEVEDKNIPGVLMEAGCALGGSAILMAKTKKPGRELQVFDVFGMIPPPGEKDDADVHERYETISSGKSRGIAGDTYYGYESDLKDKVAANFTSHGVPVESHDVALVQGLFEDTLKPKGAVALAHIDCDWYDSVWTCLERIVPQLSPGGRLIIDDYEAWSGCRKAVDDYFREKDGFRQETHARLHIIKNS